MKSNLASLHIFENSSLTSNSFLLLKLSFHGTIPDVLTIGFHNLLLSEDYCTSPEIKKKETVNEEIFN